jgi:hypothetical protein
MVSTHGTVSYSDGQRGGERRCIPRRRRRGLPTEAVGTPALLKAHGTRQWDGAWRMMCPVVSDTRARAEETTTDRWARRFRNFKAFQSPKFEIRIGVLLSVQNSPNFASR